MLTNGKDCDKLSAWQAAITFVLKPIQNQPLAFITMIALAAAAVLYHDARTLMLEQTTAYQRISQTLVAIEVRLQEIENRINTQHTQ